MPRITAGEIDLGWRQWGEGRTTVVFIHGNLASKDWLEAAAKFFPQGIRVIGIDWRGCGESDRPPPEEHYTNYSMQQHASDLLAALDALDIPFCHLATHSTGGIIAARMLLAQPERFGKVLALDPVSPIGLPFMPEQIDVFRAMMTSRAVARAVMATTAASLFQPETLAPGKVPVFKEGPDESRAFFERLVDQTLCVSEGVWLGTPYNLDLEYRKRELASRTRLIAHEHLVLWGEQDDWIPVTDLRSMAATMPNCRLVCVPNVGHSMNLEQPALYAGYFGGFFGGLPR
jgi:pimeloyl-ACP methyl ester carboxylesterase